MKKVCVITGGGSGMGLACARMSKEDVHVILVGRTIKKLDDAIIELSRLGVEAEAYACDIADSDSVKRLEEHAAEVGEITSVIHAAGMSPHMGELKKLWKPMLWARSISTRPSMR